MTHRMKFWGWGSPDRNPSLEERPAMHAHLRRKLGIDGERVSEPVDPGSIEVPAGRLPAAVREGLVAIVGADGVADDDESRIHRTLGKSYRDLVRARRGELPRPPDAVVFPRGGDEVAAVLALASEHRIGVIPFGGGTSVVGGVEPVECGLAAQIALDLTRMTRMLDLDTVSRTATFEAGVLGPELEAALGARGYSLGHFPQSFEFSTLGGWVAARSAGQNSSRYGKIEEMVEAVTMVHPGGTWATRPIPARSSGPEWREVLVGSEGTLGVITEATVRVHPIPEATDYRGWLFRSFRTGLDAVREMVQQDVQPTILRMNDADYTEMALQVLDPGSGGGRGGIAARGVKVVKGGLDVFGYGVPGACLMLVGFEGTEEGVSHQMRESRRICMRHRAMPLGSGPGHKWKKERFDHPYMRDDMMNRGILVETLETATNWGNVDRLYRAVRTALRTECGADQGRGLVLAHMSHVYPEGGSLYFTFMTRAEDGKELEQWARIKAAASDAILSHDGTISHHHGVGMDHGRWMAEERGPSAMASLAAVKAVVDPESIMNPGKLNLPLPGSGKGARKAGGKTAKKKAARRAKKKTTRRAARKPAASEPTSGDVGG